MKITVSFTLLFRSRMRWICCGSAGRLKTSFHWDRMTLFPFWYASPVAASTALSAAHHEDVLARVGLGADQAVHHARAKLLPGDAQLPQRAAPAPDG
ncbi:MAG: hypothetical protein IPG75_09900 [Gemmatimonadetes bacterium]|nr:hypothetical protein [Gemmatimonadota bacterium]